MNIYKVIIAFFVAVFCLTVSPAQARFLQADPIGYQDDLDLYTYVHNDPTDNVDPSGRDPDDVPRFGDVEAQGQIDADLARAQAFELQARIQDAQAAQAAAAAAAENPLEPEISSITAARELNANRGLSARLSGLQFEGHHPLPRFLGGPFNQSLATLTGGLHDAFHSGLRTALGQAGFKSPIGGKAGSARAWNDYFAKNAGAQQRAWTTLQNFTRNFDKSHGTNLSGALQQELTHLCTGSRIPRSGPC